VPRSPPLAPKIGGGPHGAEKSDHTDLAASAEEEAEGMKGPSMTITRLGDGSKPFKSYGNLP